jgi:S1-C subfamily serine protease
MRRGMLGVLLEGPSDRGDDTVDATLAATYARSTVVDEAPEGLPACDAGVERGDTIVAVDGTKVTGRRSMVSWIQRRAPNTRVTITLRSPEGEERDVEVILGELPAPEPPPAALFNGLGVRGEKVGLRVYTVDDGCPAAQADIRPGDIILSVGGESVEDEEAYVAVATGPVSHLREVEVRILRNGEEKTLTLK